MLTPEEYLEMESLTHDLVDTRLHLFWTFTDWLEEAGMSEAVARKEALHIYRCIADYLE